jgi:hypothetical protein
VRGHGLGGMDWGYGLGIWVRGYGSEGMSWRVWVRGYRSEGTG